MWKIWLFLASLCALSVVSYKNVYGDDLQTCSSAGMALTGYTRNGQCVHQYDDQGSHHICIDISTNTGGNFCEVTGQPDWCSSYMLCHDDSSSNCQIQNWCVCQWAFAGYVQNAGGCEKILDIVCESINLEAIKAYIKMRDHSAAYADALDCIAERCSLDLSNKDLYGKSRYGGKFLIWATLAVTVLLVLAWWRRPNRVQSSSGNAEPMLTTTHPGVMS